MLNSIKHTLHFTLYIYTRPTCPYPQPSAKTSKPLVLLLSCLVTSRPRRLKPTDFTHKTTLPLHPIPSQPRSATRAASSDSSLPGRPSYTPSSSTPLEGPFSFQAFHVAQGLACYLLYQHHPVQHPPAFAARKTTPSTQVLHGVSFGVEGLLTNCCFFETLPIPDRRLRRACWVAAWSTRCVASDGRQMEGEVEGVWRSRERVGEGNGEGNW